MSGYTGQVPDTVTHTDTWRDQAACLGMDGDLFYSPVPAVQDQAKAVCARCPMQAECLTAGFAGDEDGVWGGMTAAERAEVRPPQRTPPVDRTPKPGVVHGDHRTYKKHKCRCDPCKDANAIYQAELEQRKKTTPECGTSETYRRHIERGEPVDPACFNAGTPADHVWAKRRLARQKEAVPA